MKEKQAATLFDWIAAALWTAAVVALLWLNAYRYGGMLLGHAANFWLVLALLSWAQPLQKRDRAPQTLAGRIAGDVLLLACMLVLLSWVVLRFLRTSYSLAAWNGLVLVLWCIAACVPRLKGWANRRQTTWLVYALLLVVTAAFLAIVRPLTLADAQEKLRENSFEDIRYLDAPRMTPHASPADRRENGMGYYWFLADKDGETLLLAVSVTTGAVTA